MRVRNAIYLHVSGFVLVAGCCLACADTDGRDPYALWERFEHEDGAYSFYFLAPPWERADEPTASDPDRQVIAVEPLSADAGGSLETGSLQARFKAVVTLREHTSAETEAHADAARISESTENAVVPTPFKNASGQPGQYIEARLSDRNLRAVYFDTTDNRTVVLELAGRDSVDGADFSLLLEGVATEESGNSK